MMELQKWIETQEKACATVNDFPESIGVEPQDDLLSDWNKYCAMLQKAAKGRDSVDYLIDDLNAKGFWDAPASGGNHSHEKGGLLKHSLNVQAYAEKIGLALLGAENYNRVQDSVTICALLHDYGKCGDYGKELYVPNMVKNGRPTKANPEQKFEQSETKPWKRNADLSNIPHGIRSVIMIERAMPLTEDEEYAIAYHDGLYEPSNKAVIPGHETPLLLILHWADMWASQVVEK